MNKHRLLMIITSAIGLISCFLPWLNNSYTGNISGFSIGGWITFILFGIIMYVAFSGVDKKEILTRAKKRLCLILGLSSALFAIFLCYFHIENSKNDIYGTLDRSSGVFDNISFTISYSYGVYLVVIAGILISILSFIMKETQVKTELPVD
jgi:hypothetical protein